MSQELVIPAIEIDENGDVHTIYNEHVNLFDLGPVVNVHRATHIDFDEHEQEFCVRHARTNEIVHRHRSRLAAIEWEIVNFGPGGPYYERGQT